MSEEVADADAAAAAATETGGGAGEDEENKVPSNDPLDGTADGSPVVFNFEKLPTDVVPMVMTGATQAIFGTRMDEDVTESSPYKLIPLEAIKEDIRNRAGVSDFKPLQDKINKYKGTEMLIIYDRNFTFDNPFWCCTTEDSKVAFLETMRAESAAAEEEAAQEEAAQEAEAAAEREQGWTSLGSELEIEEARTGPTRPLIRLMFSRRRRLFGAPVTLGDAAWAESHRAPPAQQFVVNPDALAAAGGSGTSRPASAVVTAAGGGGGGGDMGAAGAGSASGAGDGTSDALPPLHARLVDAAVQAVPETTTAVAQTVWRQPRNAVTQWVPQQHAPVDEESAREQQAAVRLLLRTHMPRVTRALAENRLLNVLVDDLRALPTAPDLTLDAGDDGGLREVQSYKHMAFEREHAVSAIVWHPQLPGIFAAAYHGNLDFAERIKQSGKVASGVVLVWSVRDPLQPLVVLHAPGDVYAVKWCPGRAQLIVGGCDSSQIVLWDIGEAGSHKLEAAAAAAAAATSMASSASVSSAPGAAGHGGSSDGGGGGNAVSSSGNSSSSSADSNGTSSVRGSGGSGTPTTTTTSKSATATTTTTTTTTTKSSTAAAATSAEATTTTMNVYPAALSSIDEGHRAPVTDLVWLPAGTALDSMQRLVKTTATKSGTRDDGSGGGSNDGEGSSEGGGGSGGGGGGGGGGEDKGTHVEHACQFLSTAADGLLLVWDLRTGEPGARKMPSSLSTLDLTWEPSATVLLASDSTGELPATRMALAVTQGDARPPAKTEGVLADAPESARALHHMVHVGTQQGDVAYVSWEPPLQDGGKLGIQKIQHTMRSAHGGSVIALQRSPFLPNLLLSGGGVSACVWEEGAKDVPILAHRMPAACTEVTAAVWSVTRPGVFYVARADGEIEAWDLLDSSYAPVSTSVVTSHVPLLSVSATVGHLAVGDARGSVHTLEIPKGLALPVGGTADEATKVRAFVTQELNRLMAKQPRAAPPLSAAVATEEAGEAGGDGAAADAHNNKVGATVTDTDNSAALYEQFNKDERAFLENLGLVEPELAEGEEQL